MTCSNVLQEPPKLRAVTGLCMQSPSLPSEEVPAVGNMSKIKYQALLEMVFSSPVWPPFATIREH